MVVQRYHSDDLPLIHDIISVCTEITARWQEGILAEALKGFLNATEIP